MQIRMHVLDLNGEERRTSQKELNRATLHIRHTEQLPIFSDI
jgi:hypothetical protein